MAMPNPSVKRISMFSLKGLRTHKALIPLVTLVSLPCIWGTTFAFYSLYQKTDVTVVKTADEVPHERIDVEQPQKLLTYNQQYKKIPELEKLKKEIGSYHYYK